MAFVAPWLVQNNPLDFMRAGAALGLQRRAQQAAEEQAIARNELAQQELAQQRELATARAAEALRQHNAMEAYRRSQISLGERTLAAKKAADALRNQGVGTEEITVGGQQFARNPRTGALYPIKPPATEREIKPLDLAPGRYRMGNQIITVPEPKTDLTPKQRIDLEAKRVKLLEESDPSNPAVSNLLQSIETLLAPRQTNTPSGPKRYRYDASSGKLIEVR